MLCFPTNAVWLIVGALSQGNWLFLSLFGLQPLCQCFPAGLSFLSMRIFLLTASRLPQVTGRCGDTTGMFISYSLESLN